MIHIPLRPKSNALVTRGDISRESWSKFLGQNVPFME